MKKIWSGTCKFCSEMVFWYNAPIVGIHPYDMVEGKLTPHYCKPRQGVRDPITEERLKEAAETRRKRGRTEWKEAV